MLTLCTIAHRAKNHPIDAWTDPQKTNLGTVASNTRHTLDVVVFVWFALRFACEATRGTQDPYAPMKTDQINARRICLALRDFAMIEFGAASAPERLFRWEIATRNQVQTFINEMVRFGALQQGPTDSFADFTSPSCPDPVPGENDQVAF